MADDDPFQWTYTILQNSNRYSKSNIMIMSSPAIPSNSQLRAKIVAILDKDKDDLSVLSVKKVRQQLETDFGFECDV